jgi:Uma2 family endonuclease
MASPHALPRSATWDDIRDLPEGTRAEILDGEIVLAPAPLPRHARAQTQLVHRIGGPFDFDGTPGGWWILPTVDVQLEPHFVAQPDVVGWRHEHMPVFPEERPIRVVPDWVCEILSPSNRRNDLLWKADLYLRVGVPFYWIVDPEYRTLQALRRQASGDRAGWFLLGTWSDGDAVGVEPFDALRLDVGAVFPPEPPAPADAARSASDADPGSP